MTRYIRRVVIGALAFHTVLLGTCAATRNWLGVAVNVAFLILRVRELDGAA